MARFAEYDRYDALGLAGLVRKREVTSAELVEEAIARIEEVNPRLNAVVTPMYQQARAAAVDPRGGPFMGVPFLVKDLISAVAGVPLTQGSKMYRGYVPAHDAELIKRYRAAGLVIAGKTNSPELGLVPFTEPALHGPTRNPWSTERTAGGSSGGAAAAVAAGIVPMAHGGDGGGSIRIPASANGVFGFKPTRGRTPAGPDATEHWFGFAIEHVLSRTVRDSAAALDATEGAEPTSPYHAPPKERPFLDEVGAPPGRLRIGFFVHPVMPATVHPEVVEAVEEVARLLEELGHDVVPIRTQFASAELARAFFTIVAGATAADIADAERLLGRKATWRDWETETWLVGMFGRQLDAGALAESIRVLQRESRRLAQEWAGFDAILTPTLSRAPVPIGSLRPQGFEPVLQQIVARGGLKAALKLPGLLEQSLDRVYDFMPHPPLANYTGRPSMSLPLVWNADGLPIGTMLTGRFGEDAVLFRLAAQLEEARPWRDRRPPVRAG